MKLNKLMLSLIALTLTSCGSNNGSNKNSSITSQPEELKQPQISAAKAKEIGESIFDFIDDSYEDVTVPDECTLRYSYTYHQSEVMDDEASTNDMTSSHLAIYSKAKSMYYTESTYTEVYNGKTSSETIKRWVFVEGETAYMYQTSIEDDDDPIYGYETEDASKFDLDEYAKGDIALENSDIIWDNINDFEYSDTAPELDTTIEDLETTFESYYGSYNDSSLQVIEDLYASCPDYVIDDIHLSTTEQSSTKMWIENYLTSHYETNSEVHQAMLGTENRNDYTYEYLYNLSEVAESIPELDKTLFLK